MIGTIRVPDETITVPLNVFLLSRSDPRSLGNSNVLFYLKGVVLEGVNLKGCFYTHLRTLHLTVPLPRSTVAPPAGQEN
jgi:hypothetical protein